LRPCSRESLRSAEFELRLQVLRRALSRRRQRARLGERRRRDFSHVSFPRGTDAAKLIHMLLAVAVLGMNAVMVAAEQPNVRWRRGSVRIDVVVFDLPA